ncbi:pentatricopeptide repeat-containing protein At2g06000-like [Vicia villosa]|uniref:pentatricopeptide repeat-containing protein At2g06000-like n=1 Tax=Vicia villosa TaxID=3911 RepID=UPI00273B4100|nr:pentatricopeptide repeat-containing protein At2g06000-like [Vicia villosa]XP_058729489.1 pentatricopeptide repeat-containing protein At2g06000-like [Vicia villosa]
MTLSLIFTTFRISNTTLVTHYHTLKPNKSEAWFVKIVSTLFLRFTNPLDVTFSRYVRNHLTPSLTLQIIKKLNNPQLGFTFFQFTKQKLNLSYSFWTYNFLLRSLCQENQHSLAKLVYHSMRADGLLPDSRLLGFLVSSFAFVDRFDVSKEFINDALCNKVDVNVAVYNNFLNILVKSNRLHDAVSLFRELVRFNLNIDIFTFNILIRGFCVIGEIDEAFRFLNNMRSFGCYPDVVSYNTLIHGLCRINEVDRARDLVREICLRSEFGPNVLSYTIVISGYCKLSKMKEASGVFDEMVSSGAKPSVATFNALIYGFVKAGDMASALGIHKRMLFHGCSPDVVTFTLLIDGYCRVGQLNYGLDVWNEMKARNVSANLYTFSILISAMCRSNRLEEARELLILLNQSDIVPQPFIYNPVIDGYCKSGNVDEANAIVVDMENKCKPDKLTFTILIIGHCMKGRAPEAIGIFYKMLATGCSPDDVTIRTLSSCVLKSGMPSEAARVKEALFKNQSTNSYMQQSLY